MASFNRNYLSKGPIFKYSQLKVRASTQGFGGDSSVITTSLCITTVPHHLPRFLSVAYRVFPTPQRLWVPQLYLLLFFSELITVGHYSIYLFVFWLYWDATSLEMENLSPSAQNSQSLEQGLALTRCSVNICGRKEGTFPLHFALLTPLKLWAPPMLFPGSTTHFQPLLCLDKCNLFSSIQLHGLLSLQSLCGLSTLVQDIGCAMLYWNSLLVYNCSVQLDWKLVMGCVFSISLYPVPSTESGSPKQYKSFLMCIKCRHHASSAPKPLSSHLFVSQQIII